jgi:hypothetical protein
MKAVCMYLWKKMPFQFFIETILGTVSLQVCVKVRRQKNSTERNPVLLSILIGLN